MAVPEWKHQIYASPVGLGYPGALDRQIGVDAQPAVAAVAGALPRVPKDFGGSSSELLPLRTSVQARAALFGGQTYGPVIRRPLLLTWIFDLVPF